MFGDSFFKKVEKKTHINKDTILDRLKINSTPDEEDEEESGVYGLGNFEL